MDEREKKEFNGTRGPGGTSAVLCWNLFVAVEDEAAQSTRERESKRKTLMDDLKAKTDQKVDQMLLCLCAPCFCLG